MKVFVVANYASGQGKCARCVPVISKKLFSAGHSFTLYKTVGKEETLHAVRDNASSHDLIVCLGGDGTLNEVVNGCMLCGADIPIGYIPCGSTNDFASNYHIPSNPSKAIENILRLNLADIDVGEFNGNYFCYVAAAGAFSEVSYATSRRKKKAFGHMAYVLEGAKSVPKIKPITLRMETDGEVYNGRYLICTVSNSETVAGMFHFGRDMVSFSDGLFEVALISEPKKPADYVTLFNDLIKGCLESKYITIVRSGDIHITSDEKITWSLDGEFGGEYTDMHIVNHKGRLHLAL